MRGSGWAEDSVPSLAEWGNIGCLYCLDLDECRLTNWMKLDCFIPG